jgi:hypothetical protein
VVVSDNLSSSHTLRLSFDGTVKSGYPSVSTSATVANFLATGFISSLPTSRLHLEGVAGVRLAAMGDMVSTMAIIIKHCSKCRGRGLALEERRRVHILGDNKARVIEKFGVTMTLLKVKWVGIW